MQLRDQYTNVPYPWRDIIFLVDSNNQKWSVSVTTNGNLVTQKADGNPSLPAFKFFCLKDSSNVYWRVLVLPTGNLDTTNDGMADLVLSNLFLSDPSGIMWHLSILTTGNLVTS